MRLRVHIEVAAHVPRYWLKQGTECEIQRDHSLPKPQRSVTILKLPNHYLFVSISRLSSTNFEPWIMAVQPIWNLQTAHRTGAMSRQIQNILWCRYSLLCSLNSNLLIFFRVNTLDENFNGCITWAKGKFKPDTRKPSTPFRYEINYILPSFSFWSNY